MQLVYIAALVSALVSGLATWFITDTFADAEIAAINQKHMAQERDDATAALKQFKDAAQRINDAADRAQLDLTDVNAKLDLIRKGRKNAPSLPADCNPDGIRVRSLSDSINTTNRAIAGQEPRGRLPDTVGSGSGF